MISARRVVIVLLLVVSAPATGWPQASGRPTPMIPEAREHFIDGADFYETGEFDLALEEFERGGRIDPHPDFLYALAQVQRQKGNCVRAIRLYGEFLATAPPQQEAQRARANMLRCEEILRTSAPSDQIPSRSLSESSPSSRSPAVTVIATVESHHGDALDTLPREDAYPMAQSLRPITLPRDMIEFRTALEFNVGAWRLPLAVRIGLRDRLELQAGVDALVSAEPYYKRAYDVDRRSGLPLDNVRLSMGLASTLYRDAVGLRVTLEAPVNRAFSSPFVRKNWDGSDLSVVVDDHLGPPGSLHIVFGAPIQLIVGRYVALVLDNVLTVQTSPTSRPDAQIGLALTLTPTQVFSVLLRHETKSQQLYLDAVNHVTSAGLQLALGHWGDLGLSLLHLRHHHGIALEAVNEATDFKWQVRMRMFWGMQLYLQKRF